MNTRELTILQHLGELRVRLIVCVVALLVGTAASWAFYELIIEILVRPAGERLQTGEGGNLIFIEVTEGLTTSVKVSLLSGFILTFPVILYQFVMFVAPGLSGREKRYLVAFLPAMMLAFASGIAFGYFVLSPPALNFLLGLGGDVATPMIRVSNAVNLMIRLLFWMGIAFETPLVMYLLAILGVVTVRRLVRFRRFWLVISFVLAAIITPTFDPVNQVMVAVPLLVLYEVGILLARFAARKRPSTEEAITPVN